MISFKGAQFPKEVILFAVFSYVRYTVSYRDLEEIMAERGVHCRSCDAQSLGREIFAAAGHQCPLSEAADVPILAHG